MFGKQLADFIRFFGQGTISQEKGFIMRNWFRRFWQSSRKQHSARPVSFRPTLEGLEERSLPSTGMGMMMGMNGGMTSPAQMPPSTMMHSSTMMMQPYMTMQSSSNAMMGTPIDNFFHMLDSRILAVESALVARMPQMVGAIQAFNAMVTMDESAIAGHPINDLVGKI
jgi:hypothetical protein